MENIDQATPQPKEEAEETTEETTEETQEESTEESNNEVEELRRQLEERDSQINDLTGKLKRVSKKAEKPKTQKAAKADDSGLDYGKLAYHNTVSEFKIEANEDVEMLEQAIEDSGKSQEEVLNSKWFQEDINTAREARAAKQAVPKSTKRSNQTAVDDVSYHLQKIQDGSMQLNDIKDSDLRRKVLNARIKAESGPHFTSSSVLTG